MNCKDGRRVKRNVVEGILTPEEMQEREYEMELARAMKVKGDGDDDEEEKRVIAELRRMGKNVILG